MINQESLAALEAAQLGKHFMRPIYDTYSFSRLPGTVAQLLSGQPREDALPAAATAWTEGRRYDKVVMILLDAFGWEFVTRALGRKYAFLQRLADEGVVSKLSTQFPSTTTAHITTLRTGLPVGQHGLYEWFMYEPTMNDVIVPLMFSLARTEVSESLRQVPAAVPSRIYPRGLSFYQQLEGRHGAKSYLFEPGAIAGSTYNRNTCKGARVLPYKTFPEALVNLAQLMSQTKGPAFYGLYYDGIDSLCHKHGPGSPQVQAETDAILHALENTLEPLLRGLDGNTALLLTADHGHADLDPASITYLNVEIPELPDWLRTNGAGEPLRFAGSPRDAFLHMRPEFVDEAYTRITALMQGRAEVFKTADLIGQGFFGPDVSELFRSRVAELVVLPYEHQAAWWLEPTHDVRLRGCHGGLSRTEAETVLLFGEYGG